MLDALDAANEDVLSEITAEIETLQEEIKADVLACGLTQNGDRYQAVYYRGRVTWDTKQLDIIAAQMPIINSCRKVGSPYVVIKAHGATS